MRNPFKALILMIAMVFMTSLSFAAVGVRNNDTTVTKSQTVGTSATQATDLNFLNGVTVTTDGSVVNVDPTTSTGNYTFQTNLIAEGSYAASTQVASSSTNLAPANLPWAYIYKNVGSNGGPDNAGVGTQLPNGVPGQVITLVVVSGMTNSATWVVTPNTSLEFQKATFSHKGDCLTLLYVNNTIGWVIQSSSGSNAQSPTVVYSTFTGN
jgi:hypothetical protein